MKYIRSIGIIAGIFIYSCYFSFSQNLAPNPSFEDTVSCPQYLGQVYLAPPWYDPTGTTSDYYNACSQNSAIRVPFNDVGYQNAHSGNAYMGFAISLQGQYSVREYISAPLLDTLEAGKKYCISFYVSLSDKSLYAANGIAAYFSQKSVPDTLPYYLPFTPQVEEVQVIKDIENWVLISGDFIANGGEKYITVGSFRNNNNTTTDTMTGNNLIPYMGYYYIDDVSVYLCQCDTTPPVAKFNYTADTLTATFNNLSSSFSNYWLWDFGDGNTDTAYSPVHTYDSSGVYTVTFVAWYNGCSDTMVASVAVNNVGEKEFSPDFYREGFRIYPNPVKDKIFFTKYFPFSNVIFRNIIGQKIYSCAFEKELDISFFPPGAYVVEIAVGEKIFRSKLLKQ